MSYTKLSTQASDKFDNQPLKTQVTPFCSELMSYKQTGFWPFGCELSWYGPVYLLDKFNMIWWDLHLDRTHLTQC